MQHLQSKMLNVFDSINSLILFSRNEPENPDPYHDNGPSKEQNVLLDSVNEDCFFNDDFEQAIDLEAVIAIEQQSKEIEIAEVHPTSTKGPRPTNGNDMQQNMEEFFEDVNFEPLLETWLVKKI